MVWFFVGGGICRKRSFWFRVIYWEEVIEGILVFIFSREFFLLVGVL